jgi:hypothetical protein
MIFARKIGDDDAAYRFTLFGGRCPQSAARRQFAFPVELIGDAGKRFILGTHALYDRGNLLGETVSLRLGGRQTSHYHLSLSVWPAAGASKFGLKR